MSRSSIAGKVRVIGNVPDAVVDGGAILHLSVNNNIRLVVTGAGKEVCSLFALIVGGAEIGVAVAGINFEAAKPVDQPNVKHTTDRVTAVNGGSTVLQNVDVINQPKWKQVEVHSTTEKRIEVVVIAGKTVRRETASVLQHKGFLGRKTAQVDFRLAITDGVYVFIDRRPSSHRQFLNKISGTAHAEPGNIITAVGIDRLWPDFFSGRNV